MRSDQTFRRSSLHYTTRPEDPVQVTRYAAKRSRRRFSACGRDGLPPRNWVDSFSRLICTTIMARHNQGWRNLDDHNIGSLARNDPPAMGPTTPAFRTCTHTDSERMHRRIVELVGDPERSMGSWFSPAARQRNKANPAKMTVQAPVVPASLRRNKASLHESSTDTLPEPLMPTARARETAKRTHEFPRGLGFACFTDLADDSASGNPAGRSDDARRHDGSDCRVGRASTIHADRSGREGWSNPCSYLRTRP
jgi:hypothetical protein